MHHVCKSLHLKKAKMFHYNVIVYNPPLDIEQLLCQEPRVHLTNTITCINITTLIKPVS